MLPEAFILLHFSSHFSSGASQLCIELQLADTAC